MTDHAGLCRAIDFESNSATEAMTTHANSPSGNKHSLVPGRAGVAKKCAELALIGHSALAVVSACVGVSFRLSSLAPSGHREMFVNLSGRYVLTGKREKIRGSSRE